MSTEPSAGEELREDLELAVRAATQAGRAVMRRFGADHDVVYKSPDQPLTQADLEANAILEDVLRSERPGYGWLSEETADEPDRLEARRVWIVDPIDGTRSYIEGYPEFAISVGLVEGDRVVAGVVYNPAKGEMFTAIRGEGAHLLIRERGQNEDGGAAVDELAARRRGERLSVRAGTVEEQRVMLASRSEIAAGEFDPFHGGWRIQPVGSTAYKLARIAAGAGDVYLSRGPRSEWDLCAGELLVEEAGGRVTDVEGSALRYNRATPYVHGVLATNGRMHTQLLGLMETMPPPPRSWDTAHDPLHPGLDEGDGSRSGQDERKDGV